MVIVLPQGTLRLATKNRAMFK